MAAGMTQEEFAKKLGLTSKQHISRMERGVGKCSIDLLIEIMDLLHVSSDYLLLGTDSDKEGTRDSLLAVIAELVKIAQSI